MFRLPSGHVQAIKIHKIKLQLQVYFCMGRLRSRSPGVTMHTSL